MIHQVQRTGMRIGWIGLALFLTMEISFAQTGRGVQTFVPSESQIKLEEAMTVLREADDIRQVAAEAERLMRDAIASDVKQTRAYYNLVVLLLRTDRKLEAKRVLDEALKNNPDFGDGIALMALMQESQDRGEVSSYYQNALKSDPMSAVANNHMASLAIEKSDWQGAILHSRKALVGNPESLNAYLNMAMSYYRQGQFDLAILVCRSGLRHDANNAALLNLEGLILLKKDEVKEALARFNKAVAADPANLEARLNAGALTLNYNDFQSALGHFDAAAQIDSSHREAILSKGVALRGLERYDEALAVFQDTRKRFPEETRAQYNLCILRHEHMNQYDLALVACKAFASLIDEKHGKFEEMKKRIAGIESTIEALKE